VSLKDWFKHPLRSRDQETVELAEAGIASEDEKQWTEEQVAKHRDPPDGQAPEDP
jgi:hypothetical protein